MKKVIVAVVALVLVGLAARRCYGDSRAQSVAVLQGVANEINQRTPRQVNPTVELTSAAAEQGALILNYRALDYEGGTVSLDRVRSDITRAACAEPKVRKEILDRGVMLKVIIADRYGAKLPTLAVLPNSC